MEKSYVFWGLMILWLVFAVVAHRQPPEQGPRWMLANDVVIYILLALLGWQVFGQALK